MTCFGNIKRFEVYAVLLMLTVSWLTGLQKPDRKDNFRHQIVHSI